MGQPKAPHLRVNKERMRARASRELKHKTVNDRIMSGDWVEAFTHVDMKNPIHRELASMRLKSILSEPGRFLFAAQTQWDPQRRMRTHLKHARVVYNPSAPKRDLETQIEAYLRAAFDAGQLLATVTTHGHLFHIAAQIASDCPDVSAINMALTADNNVLVLVEQWDGEWHTLLFRQFSYVHEEVS
jgi:hypothetical protein